MTHELVSAALLISGAYELEPIRDTYLNANLRLTDSEIATLSPLRLPAVQKPAVITYGTVELQALVDDSIKLHEKRWRRRAVDPSANRRRGPFHHRPAFVRRQWRADQGSARTGLSEREGYFL